MIAIQVLGPVAAYAADGSAIALRGPRHRAVLARLVIARGRVVPVERIVDDLWTTPPDDAIGAVRTFVAALRRALEPDRAPRAQPQLLRTEGPGYAVRLEPDAIDAWRFEAAITDVLGRPPGAVDARLTEALGWWHGPAYADVADAAWARAEHVRLTELRLLAVERRAEARLALGRAGEVAAELDAHVADHPWREHAWAVLARALYRTGRQADALAVLARARRMLVAELGLDPGPELMRVENDILHGRGTAGDLAEQVWADTTAAYGRAVPGGARLEWTVGLLRSLALTGGSGLHAARAHRLTAIAAAQEQGDPAIVAGIIGAFDVPAIWARADDPEQAAQVVAAAGRALASCPDPAGRARLLATIAVESRGGGRARAAAEEAVGIARRLDDPRVLAFALNGLFMQSFGRSGLAAQRDTIGAELVALSAAHGLGTFEILGHLVRMQARSGLGDLAAADRHATAADRLATRHESPLTAVFTGWYRVLRRAGELPPAALETAYEEVAGLDGGAMPGFSHGLLPLAVLCARAAIDLPAPTDDDLDRGPYAPWAAAARGDLAPAALPDPPHDHMAEALWVLAGKAGVAADDARTVRRARAALAPAAAELAGAASGVLTLGPVARHLAAFDHFLGNRSIR